MRMLAIELTEERRSRGFIQIEIPGHGLFTGYLDTVTAASQECSQMKLAQDVHNCWPDLWTLKDARKLSAFVLALILNQE